MRGFMAIVLGLLVSGFGIPDSARTSPQYDVIGLYTTLDGAMINTLNTTTANQPIEIYLMILDSTLGGTSGWECGIRIDGREGTDYIAPVWSCQGDGLNVAAPPLFNVGLGLGPLALRTSASGAVHLATFSCFVIDPTCRISLTVDPFPDSVTFPYGTGPGYIHPDDLDILQPLVVLDKPTFTINHVASLDAGFSYVTDFEDGYPPLTATFSNTTVGPAGITYTWDFGDGDTSSLKYPVHTYTAAGAYTISMTATAPDAEVDSHTGTIIVNDPTVTAEFHRGPANVFQDLVVSFNSTSTGEILDLNWDFGDGTGSNQANTTHIFTAPGTYTVTLTVTGPINTSAASETIVVSGLTAIAAFTAQPLIGYPPLQVLFTNQSSGMINAYLWLFGDGTTSGSGSTNHYYYESGTFIATLIVNPGTANVDSTSQTITVLDPTIVTSFTADPLTGSAPLTVNFTNTSSGHIVSTFWRFGDGTTSYAANPVHVFTHAGIYDVILTVPGSPAINNTHHEAITVLSDTPLPAILSWSPEPGFGDDGVTPDLAAPGTEFEFRVVYTHLIGDPPAAGYPKLLLDADNDGDADDPGDHLIAMTPALPVGAIQTGRDYVCTIVLDQDADYRYRFEAVGENGLPATGEPISWRSGPAIYTGYAPDLFIDNTSIQFEIPVTPFDTGDPLLMNVTVQNSGNLPATGLLKVIGIDMTNLSFQLIGSLPLAMEAATTGYGRQLLRIEWVIPEHTTLYAFSITDVVPEELDQTNNQAEAKFSRSGSEIGVLISRFRGDSREDGVNLAWTASGEIGSFHIERRSAGRPDWVRITGSPISASPAKSETDYSFLDTTAEPGTALDYRLLGRMADSALVGLATVEVEHSWLPGSKATITGIYPNPFNPNTNIALSIPGGQSVSVSIYDLKGRIVKHLHDGPIGSGHPVLIWDGTDARGEPISGGVYFCRLRSEQRIQTIKLMLVK